MNLCLLTDPWIPAIRNGETVTIRPDQIAERGITRLAWPRPDFNLACIELLIGLVSMAYPPEDDADWHGRLNQPETERLREKLTQFAPYFLLGGAGPRFLQDLEAFEHEAKPSDIKPVDMLYIDSAGRLTVAKNADLMVKRDRFTALAQADAAMALYTLQAFAPSGGGGNRTSMRGGGPMITLIQPLAEEQDPRPLWRLVFSNVLPGPPLSAIDARVALPWLRPTHTSEKGQVLLRDATHPLEAFFGMPRRLRLVLRDDLVTGVVQRPHGTNYAGWEHPLTPHYRRREDDQEWLPVHPNAGRLSYRNWRGITMQSDRGGKGTRRVSETIRVYTSRPRVREYELLVGGWAMDKMKPVNFSLDTYPGFPGLDENGQDRVRGLLDAANTSAGVLRTALKEACLLEGSALDAVVEAYFAATEEAFGISVQGIAGETGIEVEQAWHRTLRDTAVHMFDERVFSGLAEHDIARIEKRVVSKRNLLGALAKQVRTALNLPVPGKTEKQV
ncbi:MAG: type I-E CRISPR-associated protein Cse1/CasA [Acidobacteria bacterium]|nr:type I-E CRISPR-associated protein Cse1/CasA [Acidobacteriota bacterium]